MKKNQIETANRFIDAAGDFMKRRGLEAEFFNFCAEHHPEFANTLLKMGAVSLRGCKESVKT